jgi:flagellar basal-body rod protein FlgC
MPWPVQSLKGGIKMISAASSALSALNAIETKMSVLSNNVANSQTNGFKKSRADLKESKNGGIEVEITKVNTSGPIATVEENGGMVEKEMSNVDLAEELPQTIVAKTGYEANLKMLKTQDEMLGSLLDIIG